jgi:tetratricopeptide (TPR) repeat protein
MRDSKNTQYRLGEAIALEKLGDIAKAQRVLGSSLENGQMQEALNYYQRARSEREALWQEDPENLTWIRGLAISDSRLGDWYYEDADWRQAETFYLASLERRSKLFSADPTSQVWVNLLGVAHGKLDLLYRKSGELTKAEQHGRQRLQLAEQNYLANPDNSVWAGEYALANYHLATLCSAKAQIGMGSEEEAKPYLLKAQEVFKSLKEKGYDLKSYDNYSAEIEEQLSEMSVRPPQ